MMKDDKFLYYIYLGLWGNQDYVIQCESAPLTYAEFRSIEDKSNFMNKLRAEVGAVLHEN